MKRPPKRPVGEEISALAKETHSDVLGSYTGDPLYDEQPIQDADDL